MIRYSPKPRYVKLLPALTEDDDPMVKAEAIAVKKELDRILEGSYHREHLGSQFKPTGEMITFRAETGVCT